MIYFGDRTERAEAGEIAAEIEDERDALRGAPDHETRHAGLVSLLIRLGQLTQSLADCEAAERGMDWRGPQERLAMANTMRAARALCASIDDAPPHELRLDWTGLAQTMDLQLRAPEGYAFYALYPESFAAAARALSPRPGSPIVGLRSIGTSLSAIVAARLAAPAPATVRPIGHPFARKLALSDDLRAHLARTGAVLAVDEGPGLSGSSLHAVAEALEPHARVSFLSAHGELGTRAPAHIRDRWARARRENAHAHDHAAPERIVRWAEPLIGACDGDIEDLSRGRWRALLFDGENDWPPIHPHLERRKLLVRAGGRAWRLKFSGLGAFGRATLDRARRLGPPIVRPIGLTHGFLVEPWIEGVPLSLLGSEARATFAARIGTYLGARARALPAAKTGANAAALLHMTHTNVEAALGAGLAQRLVAPWRGRAAELDRMAAPVLIDGAPDPHEYLLCEGAELVKTDALDHCASHDLVGAQDVTWDLAATCAAFGWSGRDAERLVDAAEQALARPVSRLLLAFHGRAWRALRLAWHHYAMQAWANRAEEIARHQRASDKICDELSRLATA